VRTLITGEAERFDHTPGFVVSVVLHLLAVIAVIVVPTMLPPEDPRPVFNRQIRPYAEHLIWYNLRTKLPEVKPAEVASQQPPRAHLIYHQQIVAGQIELPRPPQLIRVPAPEIRLAQPLKLPNMLAAALAPPPKPVRPFAPPPEQPARPPEERPLPAAPQIRTSSVRHELSLETAVPRPRPLPFVAPETRSAAPEPTDLAAAPVVAAAVPAANMPRIPRGFTAPPERKTKVGAAELDLPGADATVAVPAQPQTTVAIVGLNPIDAVDVPKPPRAHEAGFSAGPHHRVEGGAAAPAGPAVLVPDLMAHGGSRSTDPALMAALRPLTRESIVQDMLAGRAAATPVTVAPAHTVRAPDPRLDGRAVYAISIQMPNVTSFSGSWLVWFAERSPLTAAAPPNMQSPVALRKVDPKYFRETIHERVEGTVRLFAVIRKDGQVDAIEILHGIDGRLDRSAAEALAKWQFAPAKRDGIPVDVDAVFEVPFRLAPTPGK